MIYSPLFLKYRKQSLTNGLVSYWSFDDDSVSGSIVSDLHGSNDGTIGAAVTTGQTGKINESFTHSTGTVHIDVADDSSLDLDDTLSFSCWVYPTTLSSFRVIGAKRDRGSNNTNYQIYTSGTDWRFYDGSTEFSSTQALSTGSWQHLVVTVDKTNSEIKFYYNNSNVNTISSTPSLSTNSALFQIGEGYGNADWIGDIDEVGLWNRVLSPDEVSSLYNSGNGLSYDNF